MKCWSQNNRQADQKTPFATRFTSVVLTIDTAKGKETIPLRFTPDPGDPVGSARFVSDFGSYEMNQIGSRIAVTVDGKTLNGAFRGPR